MFPISRLLCFCVVVVGTGVEGKGHLRATEEDEGRLLVLSDSGKPTMPPSMDETVIPSSGATVDATIIEGVVESPNGRSTSTPTQLVVPLNEDCFNAEGPVPASVRSLDGSTEYRVSGTSRGASVGDMARCAGLTFTSPTVWYYMFGTGSVVTASTCWPGTDLDTKVSVFQGNCTQLACVGGNDDASSTVRGSCDVNRLASQVTWHTEMNELYYLVVHAFSSKVGNFELSIDALNDQCDYAVALSPGDTVRGDTRGAMRPFDGGIGNCHGEGLVGEGPSLWYAINGTGTTLQATTCNDDEDMDNKNFKIHVFEGVCGDADTCIGGVSSRSLDCSTYEWESNAGEMYYILIHASTSVFAGLFDLTVTEVGV